MLNNFMRTSWRMGRRICRTEIALLLLVVLFLWYISKWIYKFPTNFEGTSNDKFNTYVEQKWIANENGVKEFGFRQLESRNRGREISWSMRYKNYALYAVQGRRATMEDRFSILFNDKETLQMFGIYDGHGGNYVANEAEKNLLQNVMSQFNGLKPEDVSQVLMDETVELDKKIMQNRERNVNLTGSTALFGVLDNNLLYIANLGDCRAIAVKKSDMSVVQLTIDHKPNNEHEAAMVKNAGGSISWNGVWRVGGILAVSRALGDGYLKIPGFISAVPQVSRLDVAQEPLKFILLASDGLWDVVTNEEAAAFITKYMNKDDLFGARQLTEMALKRGSNDNITIMVIVFD